MTPLAWLCRKKNGPTSPSADRLSALEAKLDRLIIMEEQIMSTLADLVSKVQEETTLVQGVQTLITNLQAQIGAITAGTLTAEQQAQIDQIFTELSTNNAALTAALQANTVATPASPGA